MCDLQELPARISAGPEREVLSLVCRVHELEADKLALQGERAARQHELRRRELLLQRRDQQRRLADEIITRQRQVLQGDCCTTTYKLDRNGRTKKKWADYG